MPPDASQELVMLVGKLVAFPVTGPVLSKAVLFGERGNLPLPVLRCLLKVLCYIGLYDVEGEVFLRRRTLWSVQSYR